MAHPKSAAGPAGRRRAESLSDVTERRPSGAALSHTPLLSVAVRVRPTLPGLEEPGDSVVSVGGSRVCIDDARSGLHAQQFAFPTVLGPQCKQREVFERCGKPLVEAALSGTWR